MSKCAHCKAELIGGEPLHELTAHYHCGMFRKTEVHLLCFQCIDYATWVNWNDEEWGPYPTRLQHRRHVGHA